MSFAWAGLEVGGGIGGDVGGEVGGEVFVVYWQQLWAGSQSVVVTS